ICGEATGRGTRQRVESVGLATATDRSIRDGRLVRPLPWKMPDDPMTFQATNQAFAVGAFYSLCLVVIPTCFVARGVRKRRWTLRWLLLVPAVVAMMLVVMMTPGTDVRPLDVGSGGMASKFAAALLLLPPTLFVLY